MVETTKKKCVAEMSNDTRILIHEIESRLIENKQEMITYSELSRVVGRDIRQCGHLLRTARKNVEESNNVLIDVVHGEGLKLTDDYTGTLERTCVKIRRKSKRELTRTLRAVVADDGVSNERLTEINTRVSILGVVNEFTKPRSIKKLKAYVEANSSREIATRETMRLFGSG